MDNSIGIGDLAAILTAVGVTIYVLGLIGLAIPIRRAFTGDLSTAWYAVALVPKTVVAGQGVRIWLRWLVLFTALFLAGMVLYVLYSTPRSAGSSLLGGMIGGMILVFLPIIVGGAILGGAIGRIILTKTGARRGGIAKKVLLLTLIMLPTYLGALSAIVGSFFLVTGSSITPELLPYHLDPYFVGGSLLLVGSFLMELVPAIAASPPLPKVRVTKRPDDTLAEGVPDPMEGWLVAHNDGFWHLFVFANEQHELLAVPDNDVAAVRILEKLPERKKPFVLRMRAALFGIEATSANETEPKEDEKPGEERAK